MPMPLRALNTAEREEANEISRNPVPYPADDKVETPQTGQCIFFPHVKNDVLSPVWCNDKSKCAVCGWNPRVSEQRILRLKEKLKND